MKEEKINHHTNNSKKFTDGKKRIAIALQGGGAHGGFTWGILDRLLQEKDLIVEGVSGTSAGAMNAVCIAQGHMEGGNEGARALMDKFWRVMSETGKGSLFRPGIKDILAGKHTLYNSPGFLLFNKLCQTKTPAQMNPKGIDPLKDVINQLFDFEKLNEYDDVRIYAAATHIFTGKLKVFSNVNKDLCTDAMLATACLPTLHAPVQVSGEYYWDGGFIGNPVVFPLIYGCETPDIMLLKLNPTHRNTLPVTTTQISDRLNEITNNASIMREMRSIHFITKLIEDGLVSPDKLKKTNIHLIEDEEVFRDLGWSSKLNTDIRFLTHLFEAGRIAADKWLIKHYDQINKETTAHVAEMFI